MEFTKGIHRDGGSQRIVRFTNIAPFDFTPDQGAMYGGQPFPVKAGETKLFTFELGSHLAKHLARQMFLQKAPGRRADGSGNIIPGEDRPLWNEQDIQNLKDKILSEAYVEEPPAVLSENEKLKLKIEELNKENAELKGISATVPPGSLPPNDLVPTIGYKDKSEVIAELKKRGIAFDARQSKANLELKLK